MGMGTIICHVYEGTVGKFEGEKVTVLYGNCCSHCNQKNRERAQ